MEPKVLIGCPTHNRYAYCVDRYLESVKSLRYSNYDLLLVDNSPDDSFEKELKAKGVNVIRIKYCEPARERIVRARNVLLDKAIEGNYDYFFSLEQDVFVNPGSLKRLIAHKLPIVSGYYSNIRHIVAKQKSTGKIGKLKVELPLIWILQNEEKRLMRRAEPIELKGKGLFKVGAFGVGCLLIAKELFSKIRFRYEEERKAYDDMHLCDDLYDLGYDLFCDGNVICMHAHKDWEENMRKK